MRNRFGRALPAAAVAFGALLAIVSPAAAQDCIGDCNTSGDVTVDEVVTMVNLALTGGTTGCTAADGNADGSVTVDEIITAVNNALTGCPATGEATCGNGVVESGEDCDDGGICIGSSNAGTACDAESDCTGNGVCVGGTAAGAACADDTTCGGGTCLRCRPFGGDSCAANCTNETSIAYDLVPGMTDELGTSIESGTSGVVVYSILDLALPLTGGLVATVGKERDGAIPVVIRATDVEFPAIEVLSLACACVQGSASKTCGGVTFEADGITLANDCTADPTDCPTDRPCTFQHGPGNTSAGVVGCNGLEGINLDAELAEETLTIAASGTGGPGSAKLVTSIGIGLVLGRCTGTGAEYGPDGQFCTADDPANDLGAVGTGPVTTGTASGTALGDFPLMGTVTGSEASCSAIATGSLKDTCLVTAIPFADVPQLGDIVGTISLCAQ